MRFAAPADETHDAMMDVYMNRFAQQVECVMTMTILDSWPGRVRGVVIMSASHLVQILLPKEIGSREPISQKFFEDLLKELTREFGGATVMTERLDTEFWCSLWKRLEAELRQEEIIICFSKSFSFDDLCCGVSSDEEVLWIH